MLYFMCCVCLLHLTSSAYYTCVFAGTGFSLDADLVGGISANFFSSTGRFCVLLLFKIVVIS